MSDPIECPICMNYVESTSKNYVTTECGHCFHTNCLMKSVANKGFKCPCCRTVMAEAHLLSDIDEEEEEEEVYNDDAMRGFRMFFNNLNGEPYDTEDEDIEQGNEEFENEGQPGIPSFHYIAEELKGQCVTYEDIVKMLCVDHHEEYELNEEALRNSKYIYRKMRNIITNYTPILRVIV